MQQTDIEHTDARHIAIPSTCIACLRSASYVEPCKSKKKYTFRIDGVEIRSRCTSKKPVRLQLRGWLPHLSRDQVGRPPQRHSLTCSLGTRCCDRLQASDEMKCTREIDMNVPSTHVCDTPVQTPDMLAYACALCVGLYT